MIVKMFRCRCNLQGNKQEQPVRLWAGWGDIFKGNLAEAEIRFPKAMLLFLDALALLRTCAEMKSESEQLLLLGG